MASSSSDSLLQGLSNNLADAVERAGKSVVAVHARQHVPASGVVWQSGVVVTADHIVEREDNIKITLPNGQATTATLAGRDPGTDLAVLKVEGADLPAAEIGDSAGLKVGNIALAVARPGEAGLSASWGAISSIGGTWRTWSGGQIDRLIRPDLTMYPGFSGGPLIDGAGKVMGINTSGLSRAMTLTVPAETVDRVTKQLLSSGRVARGYLGLGMQPVQLPDNLRNTLGLEQGRGLIVVSVEQGGPAEKAGVLVGDILISLQSQRVTDTGDVQAALGPDSVGSTANARVIRGGTPQDVAITVAERPPRGA